MLPIETWLAHHGPAIAVALNSRRELICGAVSAQLAETFPLLCYDANRSDAKAFQQRTFHETPRRFHRMLQTLLHFASLTVIEQEYRWGWTILPRYGVTSEHMVTMARWYFEAAHTLAGLNAEAHTYLLLIETVIVQIVQDVTEDRVTPFSFLHVSHDRFPHS